MSKEAVFTMKLEADLRDEFMAEAACEHRAASQVVRDLMRSYIDQQRQKREYNDFLRAKVATAREDKRAGRVHSHAEVEAKATARRARVKR